VERRGTDSVGVFMYSSSKMTADFENETDADAA
jgi:hypothetical protein